VLIVLGSVVPGLVVTHLGLVVSTIGLVWLEHGEPGVPTEGALISGILSARSRPVRSFLA
jgi:hypothetical protein